MEQVIRRHERAISSNQGVNPCDLCFGMRPLGEEDAWLLCNVLCASYSLSRWCCLAWPCLETTLQRCLVGLSEPGDASDFLAWLIFIDSFLNVMVLSLQMVLCGLVVARSYC